MKKRRIFWLSTLLILVLLTLFVVKKINDGWLSPNPIKRELYEQGMRPYRDGNLKFSLPETVSRSKRKELVATTRKYIAKSVEFIHETALEDTIHLILVPTRKEMENLLGPSIWGGGIAGTYFTKNYDSYPEGSNPGENQIYAVYGEKHNELKTLVMGMVSILKWGNPGNYDYWLNEGLSTLFSPESQDCDGHTFEERYVYFLQNGKLLVPDSTMRFAFEGNEVVQNKIYRNQTAYLVGSLINNYGIEEFKRLWQSDMENFEKIYGLSFKNYILKINDGLNEKYPDPIDFNWVKFKERCMK